MPDTGFFNPQDIQSIIGITEGMQIADFGCGAGTIAIMMAKLTGAHGRVTAIDVLPSALESVQARAHHEKLTNVIAIRTNLEVPGASGLADASQDVVYLANILWQSSKQAEILAEPREIVVEPV